MVQGRDALLHRRGLLPPGHVVEIWPDHALPDCFWMSESSKALLDTVGEPLAPTVQLDAAHIAVYYGPRLTDLDSLPPEDSVKARVASAHGIAVAWITLDRMGERTTYQPQGLNDPVFYLRRVGGGASHVWRTFARRREASAYMREAYGADEEAQAWAAALREEDFDTLIARHARRA
jgi:hypothetical protein